MKLTFKGKSAIVTGACGGMGLEVCKNLSNNNKTIYNYNNKLIYLKISTYKLFKLKKLSKNNKLFSQKDLQDLKTIYF